MELTSVTPDSAETVTAEFSAGVPTNYRNRTPDAAVQQFDGQFQEVYGRQVKTKRCTREVFNFVMVAVVITSVLLAAVITLAVRGLDAPGTPWLQAIVTFCIGVFVPNPQIRHST